MVKIQRNDIKEILINWYLEKISEEELQDYINEIYLSNTVSYDEDFEEDTDGNSFSVINETLGMLDMLGENLIIKEDVHILLEFLNCKKGNFTTCYKKLNEYFKNVDYKKRVDKLRNHSFYKDFL